MRARHKRRFFLVGGADIGKVFPVFLCPPQGAVKAADAIPRVAVPLVQIPFNEPIDDEIAYGLCHCSTFLGEYRNREKTTQIRGAEMVTQLIRLRISRAVRDVVQNLLIRDGAPPLFDEPPACAKLTP